MDWIIDLPRKFPNKPENKPIQTLKADRFHGSVTIHFSDGIPQKWDLKLCGRAEKDQL